MPYTDGKYMPLRPSTDQAASRRETRNSSVLSKARDLCCSGHASIDGLASHAPHGSMRWIPRASNPCVFACSQSEIVRNRGGGNQCHPLMTRPRRGSALRRPMRSPQPIQHAPLPTRQGGRSGLRKFIQPFKERRAPGRGFVNSDKTYCSRAQVSQRQSRGSVALTLEPSKGRRPAMVTPSATFRRTCPFCAGLPLPIPRQRRQRRSACRGVLSVLRGTARGRNL